jgi:hypothetical protein
LNETCRALVGPCSLCLNALFSGNGRFFRTFLVAGESPPFVAEAADALLVTGAILTILGYTNEADGSMEGDLPIQAMLSVAPARTSQFLNAIERKPVKKCKDRNICDQVGWYGSSSFVRKLTITACGYHDHIICGRRVMTFS